MPQRFSSHPVSTNFFSRRFLPVLLAGAALFGLAVSRPAQAQLNVQTAAVLDFEVLPGLDPNLGRKAADALAVELQESTADDPVTRQRIEVVPRQRMLQVFNDNTALTPPYTNSVQMRLGDALDATSIYSGRVLSAVVDPGKAARVTVEVMVFELSMGDYSNGAAISQEAVSEFGTTDNDLLLDEALNKAIYGALLEIKRKPFPVGTIQIVTRSEAFINLGSRNGVSRGQKYAVLRDTYRGRDTTERDVVERIKIGEMIIVGLDVDQAQGILTSGGGAGFKIGDKVRKIYIPTTTPQKLQDLDAKRLKYLDADQLEAHEASEAAKRVLQAEQKREEAARRAEHLAQQRASKKKGRRK